MAEQWQPVRDTVQVGTLEQIHTATRAGGSEVYGFYAADEGSGVTNDLRTAFSVERGVSPGDVGPWVSTVKEVAIAHGWEVYVTESRTGGCRIEFEGITTTD